MRALIAVMLLMGCAVGQAKKVCMNPAGCPVDTVCPPHMGGLVAGDKRYCPSATVQQSTEPGDCYRVTQDGTLEKVDACYDNKELVRWNAESTVNLLPAEPADVPATTKSILLRKKGDYWSCGMDACVADHDMYTDVAACADKSRILLTSEERQALVPQGTAVTRLSTQGENND